MSRAYIPFLIKISDTPQTLQQHTNVTRHTGCGSMPRRCANFSLLSLVWKGWFMTSSGRVSVFQSINGFSWNLVWATSHLVNRTFLTIHHSVTHPNLVGSSDVVILAICCTQLINIRFWKKVKFPLYLVTAAPLPHFGADCHIYKSITWMKWNPSATRKGGRTWKKGITINRVKRNTNDEDRPHRDTWKRRVLGLQVDENCIRTEIFL